MSKIKRSDRQYIEIEEFADYELTQCIAYEMYARLDYHKIVANELVEFYKKNKKCVDMGIEISSSIDLNEDNSTSVIDNFIDNCDDIYKEFLALLYSIEIVNIEDNLHPYQDPRLGKEFWEIVKNYNKIFCTGINKNNQVSIDNGEDTRGIKEVIERKGYSVLYSIKSFEEDFIVEDIGTDEYKKVSNISEYRKYLENSDIHNDYIKCSSRIKENFKRPKIRTDKLTSVDIKLNINLNKPLNEIIAFIKHIKDDLDNNNLIKAPIELLDISLSKDKDLVCNKKGEKCIDPRSILSKQQKMADMFYIYDCLKLRYTQTKISNALYNYYADKGIDTITFDSATIRKYRDIAHDYIDNKRYLELLTGISIQEFD